MMTVPIISLASRIRGSIYGVAIADALGGPVEFHPRGTFPPVTSFRHNANFNLAPGTWTDDTSMTLCLAQSLVDTDGVFVAQDQIKKYIAWYEDGYMSATGKCFDIGMATRTALTIWRDFFINAGGRGGEDKGDNKKKKQEKVKGDEGVDDGGAHLAGQVLINKALKHEVQCGNGSLMRITPIPLIYHYNATLALDNAALSSILTHPHPTNTEACKIYTHLLTLIISPPACSSAGAPFVATTKASLAHAISTYPFSTPKLQSRFSKYTADLASYAAVGVNEIRSTGFVVDTLEAALWVFFTTDGFEQGALKAVNLGNDADTVGAVYGGLAGGFYGLEKLPREWLDGLVRKDLVGGVVEGLVSLVERMAEERRRV